MKNFLKYCFIFINLIYMMNSSLARDAADITIPSEAELKTVCSKLSNLNCDAEKETPPIQAACCKLKLKENVTYPIELTQADAEQHEGCGDCPSGCVNDGTAQLDTAKGAAAKVEGDRKTLQK